MKKTKLRKYSLVLLVFLVPMSTLANPRPDGGDLGNTDGKGEAKEVVDTGDVNIILPVVTTRSDGDVKRPAVRKPLLPGEMEI